MMDIPDPDTTLGKSDVSKLASAIIKELEKKDHARSFHTDHTFTEWLDKRIVDKLKIWAATLILAYSIPIVVAAYFLGSMYTKLDQALNDQQLNTKSLQARSGWMNDQEQFNCEVRRAIVANHHGAEIGGCVFMAGQDRTDPRR